jgi:hypothetical protein
MIEQTIEKAASLFHVPVSRIVRGGLTKGGAVTAARLWVIQQHPEAGCGELMRALNYKSHASIVLARRKISSH